MSDKPILFSAPMIRALLDGRKTQTRRIVKGVPDAPAMDNIAWIEKKLHPAPYLDAYCGAKRTTENPRGMTANWAYWTRDDRPGPLFKVGYVPGDRLWVREAHYLTNKHAYRLSVGVEQTVGPDGYEACVYTEGFGHSTGGLRKRPSIHMPRWSSRLTLTVTDVRVQRLQEVDRGDAMDEGCPFPNMAVGPDPRDWFHQLWNSINGPDAWDQNPFVVALTFDVHRRNIDQMANA